MPTTPSHILEPSLLVQQFLEYHYLEADISLAELLDNEAFFASYQAAITHLAACQYEIIEQGIYQSENWVLYRDNQHSQNSVGESIFQLNNYEMKSTLFELFLANKADAYLHGFTTALMKTYMIADAENRAKLDKAFPDYFVDKVYKNE